MAEVLKVFELAQQDGVAEMKVRRGGIETRLYAQRFPGGERFFKFLAQIRFANDLRAAFLDVGQLFVNRSEGWHACALYENCRVGGSLQSLRDQFLCVPSRPSW